MNRRRFFDTLGVVGLAVCVPALANPSPKSANLIVTRDGRPCVMYVKHSPEKPWIWNFVEYTDGKGGAVAWAEKVDQELWTTLSYCTEQAPW